jgi:uncharacterized protein
MCLGSMLLFTITGITLNHASQITSTPVVKKKVVKLPAKELADLQHNPAEGKRALPDSVAAWLSGQVSERDLKGIAEWSDTEVYLSLPRPGGDGWLTIDRETGDVEWEQTNRGWISYLNDLHKGRNTGFAWQVFIDVIAVAFLVFTATGLILLQIHSAKRPATWPAIAFGFAAPVLLIAIFLHI